MKGNSINRLGRWKETTDYTPTTDEVQTAFHEFASQLEQDQPGTYPAPEFSDWVQAMYGFQRWMQKVQYDAWEEGYDTDLIMTAYRRHEIECPALWGINFLKEKTR